MLNDGLDVNKERRKNIEDFINKKIDNNTISKIRR